MPVRTQSSFAKSIISSGRIEASEKKKLQDAIFTIENSVNEYNKQIREGEHRKSNWGLFKKVGQAFSTVGSILAQTGVGTTVGTVMGGIGLAMTSAGSYAQAYEAKGMKDEALNIETEAAKKLQGLLFVGDESKKVSKGAAEFKGGERERTDQYYTDTMWAGIKDTAVSFVKAGQAGSFGGELADTLNAPLMQGFEAPEGATAIEKIGYQYMESKAPSIGSLLGGATPYEQEVYGGSLKAFGAGFKEAPKGERFKGGFKSIATFLKPDDTTSIIDSDSLVEPEYRPELGTGGGDVSGESFEDIASLYSGVPTAEAIDLSPTPIVDTTTDVISTGTDAFGGETKGTIAEFLGDETAYTGGVLDFNVGEETTNPQDAAAIAAARKLVKERYARAIMGK